MAGVIHDIGKISIPSEILSKPGNLNKLEYEIMKTHPQVGYDILNQLNFLGPWQKSQRNIMKDLMVPVILWG
jgi:putative two-component system response regulator